MKFDKIQNPCFEAALKYVDLGIPVLQAGRDKRPKRSERHNGNKWGSAGETKAVNKQFDEFPQANVGLVMGGHIVGVDLDLKNGVNAIEWFEQQLAENFGECVDTWQADTPSGGRHYYFSIPDDLDFEIRNSQSDIAPGVDIRGNGGFMLAPPSRTAKGSYTWTKGPDDVELAPIPAWLLEKLRPKKKKADRPKKAQTESRELVDLIKAMGVKGKGHEAVRDFAASCAGKGSPRDFVEAVIAANAHTFDKNAKSLIDSAYEKFALTDFEEIGDDEPEAFLKALDSGKNGIYRHAANAMRLVRHMPGLKGVRGVDVLTGMAVRLRDWEAGAELAEPVTWSDRDTARAIEHVQGFEIAGKNGPEYPLSGFAPDTIRLALKGAPVEVHPIKAMIECLPKWDAKKRLDTLLTDTFGVEDTPLHRAYSRKFMIGMIARGLSEPNGGGVQLDTVLCLIGKQGIGKSTFCKVLAGERFFTDQLPDVRDDKRAAEAVLGRLIVELSEGDLLSKVRAEELKGFLTRRVDKFRPPYAENVAEFVRTCAFVMPVNRPDVLRDATGSRRFWPVECTGAFDRAAFDRDQVLAEALAAYRADEQWWLTDAEEAAREEIEHRFEVSNDMIGEIKPILANVPEGRVVTVQELLDAKYGPGRHHFNGPIGRDLKAALGKHGWEFKRTKHRNGWLRVEASEPPVKEGARATGSLSQEFEELE